MAEPEQEASRIANVFKHSPTSWMKARSRDLLIGGLALALLLAAGLVLFELLQPSSSVMLETTAADSEPDESSAPETTVSTLPDPQGSESRTLRIDVGTEPTSDDESDQAGESSDPDASAEESTTTTAAPASTNATQTTAAGSATTAAANATQTTASATTAATNATQTTAAGSATQTTAAGSATQPTDSGSATTAANATQPTDSGSATTAANATQPTDSGSAAPAATNPARSTGSLTGGPTAPSSATTTESTASQQTTTTASQQTTTTAPTTSEQTTTTAQSTTTTESTTTTTASTTTTTTATTQPPPTNPPTPGGSLLDVNFENQGLGEYTQSEMDADFNWVGNWTSGLGKGRTNITSEGGNKFLRLLFEKNTRGHVQWQADLGGAHEDVYLQYNVRFVGSGFDFRDGGKLPGLAGGTAPTGGKNSSDGKGYSARFMWRNTSSNPDAYFTQYMYDMDKKDGRTGRHVTLGNSPIYVQTDHWYTIKSHIVMNTPGQSNGVIQAWLDGQLVLDIRNARLRSSSSLGTDILYFSTFFGGGDSAQYRTSKDEHIDYDNFKVWTG